MSNRRAFVLIVCPLFLYGFLSTRQGDVAAGNRAMERGAPETALRYYERARERTPYIPDIDYNIGNAHMQMERFDEAIAAYTLALNSERHTVREYALYGKGRAEFYKKDYSAAAESFKETLKANANNEKAKRALEITLSRFSHTSSGNAAKKNTAAPSPEDVERREAERILEALRARQKELARTKQIREERGGGRLEKDW